MSTKRNTAASPTDLVAPPAKRQRLIQDSNNASVPGTVSPFFALPRELRDRIYQLLCDGRTVKFTETWWRTAFDNMEDAQAAHAYPFAYKLSRAGNDAADRFTPGLLRVCRQMHDETAGLMYSGSTFSGKFSQMNILGDQLLVPAQYQLIRSVHLTAPLDNEPFGFGNGPPRGYIEVLRDLQDLRLDLTFKFDCPPKSIELRERFKKHRALPSKMDGLIKFFRDFKLQSAAVTVKLEVEGNDWARYGWDDPATDQFKGAWRWSPDKLTDIGNELGKSIMNYEVVETRKTLGIVGQRSRGLNRRLCIGAIYNMRKPVFMELTRRTTTRFEILRKRLRVGGSKCLRTRR
ncbi:hypothetical protein EJ08DRAFT_646738 [Tothia fuscella]|uniref:DUF7730 domain-containing protein n=1 Tax=Tothia fuscella TaxID=1048955 RepID=A0A9P4U1Y9_9PEZI|nr:hypothetical protein EJ08DRAFT_646738 [Tothia fuscella]